MTAGGPRRFGRDLAVGLGVVIAGVVLAGFWRLVVPVVQERGDPNELAVAADGTLALVGMAGGLGTGLALVLRPGRVPWRRLLVGVVSGAVAGVAAAGTGWALSGWRPAAWGVVTLWPVTTTAVVFVVTCVRAAFAPVAPVAPFDPAGAGGSPVAAPQQYLPGAGTPGSDPGAWPAPAYPEPSQSPGSVPDEGGAGHRPAGPATAGWAPPDGSPGTHPPGA